MSTSAVVLKIHVLENQHWNSNNTVTEKHITKVMIQAQLQKMISYMSVTQIQSQNLIVLRNMMNSIKTARTHPYSTALEKAMVYGGIPNMVSYV